VADHDARAETTPLEDARRERLGRITFRAWRRGFREADLVLGPFIEREGPNLSDAELDMLESLLTEEDHDIYAWIIEAAPTPEQHQTMLMDRIRTFMRAHVATAVAEGAG
jgi:antitoxin CptB